MCAAVACTSEEVLGALGAACMHGCWAGLPLRRQFHAAEQFWRTPCFGPHAPSFHAKAQVKTWHGSNTQEHATFADPHFAIATAKRCHTRFEHCQRRPLPDTARAAGVTSAVSAWSFMDSPPDTQALLRGTSPASSASDLEAPVAAQLHLGHARPAPHSQASWSWACLWDEIV